MDSRCHVVIFARVSERQYKPDDSDDGGHRVGFNGQFDDTCDHILAGLSSRAAV